MNHTHKHQFAHYASSEIVALALDLIFLWILVSFLEFQYIISAALAYVMAAMIHYHTLRKHVFHGATRDPFHMYAYFIGVGVFGFVLMLSIFFVAVKSVHINYLFARIFAAVSVIPATYMLNTMLTFIMPRPLPKEQDLYCNLPSASYGQ